MSYSNTNMERWLPVVGYEELYEISNYGRLRSVDRLVPHNQGQGVRKLRGRIKKPASINSGHLTTQLWRDGKHHTYGIHCLVLAAFKGPCPPGMECRHHDDNPTNNELNNLSWGTRSENMFDRVKNGRHPAVNKKTCPRNHLLIPPNIKACEVIVNHRSCLACSRAHGNQRHARKYDRAFDFETAADEHYRLIMGTKGDVS